jgi:hypothetical protein
MSPVKYELSFYIPEDAILHSLRRGNLRSYVNPINLPNPSRRTMPWGLLSL